MGKTQLTYDSDLGISVAATYGTVIVSISTFAGPGAILSSTGITPEIRASVEQRMRALAAKYGYISVVGTIEDSSTFSTISR